jgi:hypothetical protein
VPLSPQIQFLFFLFTKSYMDFSGPQEISGRRGLSVAP